MDVTTAQLYDLLIEKGFEKSRVRDALSEIATRDEVEEVAASGFDRVRAELRADLANTKPSLVMWMAGMFIGQFLATIGTLASLYGMFG